MSVARYTVKAIRAGMPSGSLLRLMYSHKVLAFKAVSHD
jgi:hypothetical protein